MQTISTVKGVVEGCLRSPASRNSVVLYVAPPKTVLDDLKTVEDSGLVPSSKVYVGFADASLQCGLEAELFDREVKPEGLVSKGVGVAGEAEKEGR